MGTGIAGEQRAEASYHPQKNGKQLENPKIKSAERSFSGYLKGENLSEQTTTSKDSGERGAYNSEKSSEEASTLSFNIFLYVLDRFKED